jgi:hypothetical protein
VFTDEVSINGHIFQHDYIRRARTKGEERACINILKIMCVSHSLKVFFLQIERRQFAVNLAFEVTTNVRESEHSHILMSNDI